MENQTWDVFISHASEDKEYIVEPLVRALEQNGISCWYDKNNIGWGDNLTSSISDGLNQSKYVLVVLSQAFISKGWTKAELNSMLNQEISSKQKKVLPLIVGNETEIIDGFPFLKDKYYIIWDGYSTNIVNELQKLLEKKESEPFVLNEENELSTIRQKLFTSHTVYELKKLLYDVEEYQSRYPSSVDAKILTDSINKAIIKTEQLSENFSREYTQKSNINIKKVIYLTSAILLILLPIYYLSKNPSHIPIPIEHPTQGNGLGNKENNKYSLKIRIVPRDAKIKILNFPLKYKDNMILRRGVYTIEVSKKGYTTKRFDLTLEENTIKTIELEKKNKDIIYQDFNLTTLHPSN